MKNTEFNPLEVPSQRPLALTTAKKIAIEAARLGDSKKAENIVIYELGKNSSLADYAVLMSADSVPQLEAVEEAVNKAFKDRGLFVLYKEGGSSHAWKVLDYGGVLIHIFETGAREFYTMDLLYASCARIPWRETSTRQKTASAAKPKTPPPAVKKVKPAAKKKTGAAARKKIKPAKKASRKR